MPLSLETHNRIMGLYKKYSLPKCQQILKAIYDANLRPDKTTYLQMITCCAKFSLNECFQFIEEMRKENIPLDAMAFNPIWFAAESKNDSLVLRRLAEEMAVSKVAPTSMTYAQRILGKQGRDEEGIQKLLAELKVHTSFLMLFFCA